MTLAEWQYLAAGGFDVAILGLFYVMVVQSDTLKLEKSRSIRRTILLTCAMLLLEAVTVLCDGRGGVFRTVNLAADALGFALSPLIPLVLAAVFSDTLRQPRRWLALPVLAAALFPLSSPWTGWIFSVSAEGVYQRGPLFAVYVCAYIYSLLLLVATMFRSIRVLQTRHKAFILSLLLLLLAGTMVQVLQPAIHTTWYCVSVTLIFYYLFLRDIKFKYDPLTGLLNRSVFDTEMSRLHRSSGAVLIMMDLDSFKAVNDTYGHAVGDECLKSIAGILLHHFGNEGSCYRIGGDEFCVILRRGDKPSAERTMSRVVASIRKKRENCPMLPMLSYGIAVYNPGSEDPLREVLHAADGEMYHYKHKKHGPTEPE